METAPTEETPMEIVPQEVVPVEAIPVEEAPEEATSMEEDGTGVSRADNSRERRPDPVENVVERHV